jgi:hypothetical protein
MLDGTLEKLPMSDAIIRANASGMNSLIVRRKRDEARVLLVGATRKGIHIVRADRRMKLDAISGC